MTEFDPNSFANIDQIMSRSLHLNLTADFEHNVFEGFVTIKAEALVDGATEFVLDSRDLTIIKVEDGAGALLNYEVRQPSEKNRVLGQPLHIALATPTTKGGTYEVTVHYRTASTASGIQFVPPAQTCGKKHPYIFTQFQAIHARSGLPHQDTPAAKITYTARLTVPAPLRALMSAQSVGEQANDNGTISYDFSLQVPVPSYLIAIAVGDLHSKRIGPRSHVWTERELLDQSAWEFAETEKFIQTAEDLVGPYVWGKLDLLVLPTSFPLGGMENPTLTFVTPTLLAGDRSLVDTVAHEVAHSWTGNLVTNRTWGHFWLNEGFNTFLERKILQRLGGTKGEQIRSLHSIIGLEFLKASLDTFGHTHEYAKLVIDMSGQDPDDCYSKVAYEKGYNFLYYLESVVGVSTFEAWMRLYIRDFTNATVDSDDFKAHFIDHMSKQGLGEDIQQIDWNEWLYGPGLGPVLNKFDTTLADEAIDLARRWVATADSDARAVFSPKDVQEFDTIQMSMFLADLKQATPHSHTKLAAMDEHYRLTERKNGEVALWWLQVCLESGYDAIFPAAVKFVTSNGRMKYVRPIYRALYKCNPAGAELARATFTENRDFYNNICTKGLVQDVGLA